MSAVFDLNAAWVSAYVDALETPAPNRVVVRGLTDAQALRRLEYRLRELRDQPVATLTVQHDPWTEQLLYDWLGAHEAVTFVHRKTALELVVNLAV